MWPTALDSIVIRRRMPNETSIERGLGPRFHVAKGSRAGCARRPAAGARRCSAEDPSPFSA
jgi:hypothetical protein